MLDLIKIENRNPRVTVESTGVLNQSRLDSRKILSLLISAPAVFIVLLCVFAPLREQAASVLISLQTCGISPAANRNLVLTPLQAQGSGAVPVMDKIQTNTDQNGNAWVTLMPGVYQTDVRPAWGQVGVTEFYFYVDPSNAVQSAFTNLLTATNNTYPPNQYAYSAQASDARYALLPVTSNDVASLNPAQIYPPLPNGITNNQTGVTLSGNFNGILGGNGGGLTNVPGTNLVGVIPLNNSLESGNGIQIGFNGGTGTTVINVAPNGAGIPGTLTNNTTGNAATATTAQSLGDTSAAGYQQNYSQGLCFWLNAANFLAANSNLTNGAAVAPNDISGYNNYILTNAANPVLWSYGLNGLPAFHFTANTELVVSNLFLAFPYLTNNCTIEITFLDAGGIAQGQNFALTAGGYAVSFPRPFYLRTWIDNAGSVSGGESSANTAGEAIWAMTSQGLFHGGVQQAQFQTHVATVSYSYPNVWCTFDGRPVFDSRLQTEGSYILYGITNLYIGGDIAGGSYFNGYISDLRIYTNALTGPSLYALSDMCSKAANLSINRLNIIGDSIAQGLHAWVALGSIQGLLNYAFPNLLINTEGESGRTSFEEVTNTSQWINYKAPGQNFGIIYLGVNDYGVLAGTNWIMQSNMIPQTMGNFTNILEDFITNNIPVAICTLVSSWSETNLGNPSWSWRTNLNAEILTLTNLSPLISVVDVAGNNPMGTNGAYANTNFFNTDEIHPNSQGYSNMVAVIEPALQYIIGQNPILNCDTNIAPFSSTAPLQDIYGAHVYYNSNGQWGLIH